MRLPLAAVIALAVSACGQPVAPLVATDLSVKPPLPGMQMTAGYLTLHNNTAQPIAIDAVTSPQFGRVEMHETVVEDGVARMIGLDSIVIPAGSDVVFEPGGKHLMLMQPAGTIDTVTLAFRAGDAVVLSVSVAPGT